MSSCDITLPQIACDLTISHDPNGYPQTICVGGASEVISRDVDQWAYANNVTLTFSRPAKPTDTSFIETYDRKHRAECLNAHRFMRFADSREKLEAGRTDHSEVRPHSAIDCDVPPNIHNPDGSGSLQLQ